MINLIRKAQKQKFDKPVLHLLTETEDYGLVASVKHYYNIYKIQILALVLVLSVAIIAIVLGWVYRSVTTANNQKLVGLTMPQFNASLATITVYDVGELNYSVTSASAYKYDGNFLPKAINAVNMLGISEAPAYNSYSGYYFWEGEGIQARVSMITGQFTLQGSSTLRWMTEEDIKTGVSALFMTNPELLHLSSKTENEGFIWWTFTGEVEEKVIYFGVNEIMLSVTTRTDGTVTEINYYILDIVDFAKVPILSSDTTMSDVTSRSVQVDAAVRADMPSECLGEFCYVDTVYDPTGAITANSAELALFYNQNGSTFLVPVLCLKGTLTTAEGASGDATVLVDIVDWDKL